jgi:hypothetical protein
MEGRQRRSFTDDYKTQPRPRHVVWLQNRRMTPKLRVFIDYIIKL